MDSTLDKPVKAGLLIQRTIFSLAGLKNVLWLIHTSHCHSWTDSHIRSSYKPGVLQLKPPIREMPTKALAPGVSNFYYDRNNIVLKICGKWRYYFNLLKYKCKWHEVRWTFILEKSVIFFETASNYAKAKSLPEKHCSSLMKVVPIQESKAKQITLWLWTMHEPNQYFMLLRAMPVLITAEKMFK